MENTKKMGTYDIIGVGIFLSLVLFLTLFGIRYYNPILLDIDAKWIIVGSFPVLISLLLTGIIKSFKGFGVEFEVAISKVAVQDDRVISYYIPIRAEQKGSTGFLHRLSDKEIRGTSVLSFVYGKRNYYDSDVISQYFNCLTHLEYILIVDESDKFLFLIKKDVVSPQRANINEHEYLNAFVRAIENRNLLETYRHSAITEAIKYDDTIIESVRLFKKVKVKKLPIIDEKSEFIGFINRDGVYEVATNILLKQVDKDK